MAASSYTWAGKKLTPKELISSLRSDPLPLIVKVAQVPSEYEKSCPQMATGTVLWIYGSGQEERVALKTTADKTAKYISIPLEAPLKFEVVYTHERGPPTFLSSMLRGKVQSDLKVEMAGNTGNRLSSTPDEKQSVPYGTLQVVGIYKETVLQTQKIANAAGELNPQRRSLSVNCPVSLDIATGIHGKSADDFRKLKDRLKQNQSTKTANQADTSYDVALLSGVPKSLQDVHLLRHTCQLSSTASIQTSAADEEDITTQSSSTVFNAAVAKLTDKVGSDIICKGKSRDSIFLASSSGLKPAAPPVDTQTRCYYVETGPQKEQLTCAYEEVKLKPVGDVYENETLPGTVVGSREKTAKGKEDAGRRSTPLGGLKDGVYVKDWKRKEAEKLAKGTVPQPPAVSSPVSSPPTVPSAVLSPPAVPSAVPSPPAVPSAVPSPPAVPSAVSSQSAVPLPPALRSPPAVPLPLQVYEDYQGVYEMPEEMEKRRTLPTPRTPSGSAHKDGQKKSTSVLSPSVKTGTGRQMKIKSVFSGFKNPLKSFGASKSPTSPQRNSSKEEAGCETYDSLDIYDTSEDYPNRTEVKKEEKNEDSDPEENYEIPEEASKWKTLSEVPKDIKNFTISDVTCCLRLLNFGKYVKPFRERSVDGSFLRKLSKKTLMKTFQMQEFEAKQLVTFARDKWRPKI